MKTQKTMKAMALVVALCGACGGAEEYPPPWGTTGGKGDTATLPQEGSMGSLFVVSPDATMFDIERSVLDQLFYCPEFEGRRLSYKNGVYYIHLADPFRGFTLLNTVEGTPEMLMDLSYTFPPGEYIVFMNNTYSRVEIKAGEETRLHVGRIEVGSDLGQTFEYHPNIDTYTKLYDQIRPGGLEYTPRFNTDGGINVMPGKYWVNAFRDGVAFTFNLELSPDR